MTAAAGDVVYADAIVFPLGSPDDFVDVSITSIKPRVVDTSAGATVDILVCTQSEAGRIAIVTGSIDKYCASAVPWRPGTIRLGQMSSTYLMYAITSSQPGAVRIDGADVSFRKGIRWGGQWVGGNISITFER